MSEAATATSQARRGKWSQNRQDAGTTWNKVLLGEWGVGAGGWRLRGFFENLSAVAPLGEGFPQVDL